MSDRCKVNNLVARPACCKMSCQRQSNLSPLRQERWCITEKCRDYSYHSLHTWWVQTTIVMPRCQTYIKPTSDVRLLKESLTTRAAWRVLSF